MTLTQRQKIIFSLPALILSITIITLSSMPQPPMPSFSIIGKDKILHFFGFFLHFLTVYIAILCIRQKKDINTIVYALIFCVLFAIADELHQYFVPGRDADIFDLLADFIGIFIGYLLKNTIIKRIKIISFLI